MSRPLLITDCDEVLLHMIGHFREWLAEAHGVDFNLAAAGLSRRDARGGRQAGEGGTGLGLARTCSSTARCTGRISCPARPRR